MRVWLLPMVCLLFRVALTVAPCHVAIAEEAEVDARKDTLEAHAEELFALEVLPLLRTKCFGCHGEGDELRGEYYMTSRDALVRGGESGDAAIVPGDAGTGSLLDAIRWDGLEMPPKKSERLTSEEIALVEEWVRGGAPWPSLERQLAIRMQRKTER